MSKQDKTIVTEPEQAGSIKNPQASDQKQARSIIKDCTYPHTSANNQSFESSTNPESTKSIVMKCLDDLVLLIYIK
ncbi:13159_t:CDS:2 [Funneliformis geosporum]|nr:13159_t:CDS:2 [Funneliformis geosporum]